MKRLILPMILFLTGSLMLQGQEISDVQVSAVLHKDGSATITQLWDVEVVKGTEWYIPIQNLGAMEVSNLRVYENNKEFISEGEAWNTNRSIEAKAGRCGINKIKDGVELCWGQGTLGKHKWKAVFEVTNLVQSLNDYDAFNFQFINPGLVAAPKAASVTLINETDSTWTYDNTAIWAFGFEGEINLEEGKIVAKSDYGLVENGHMTLMVRFNKGLFSPLNQKNMDFAEMEKKAKKGSSYSSYEEQADKFATVFTTGLFSIPIVFLIFVFFCNITGNKYKKSLLGARKITGWYREAPLEGNIFAAYYVLQHSDRFSFPNDSDKKGLIGALFLRWILEGYIKVIPDGSRVNLDFTEEHTLPDPVENELYNMARSASGSNVILEKKEFEKWSEKHYTQVNAWPKKANDEGWAYLTRNSLLFGTNTPSIEGQNKMRAVIEFRNFLKDFTLASERGAVEVKLWKDYLVYAQLFGIADKVSDQLKKLFPAEMDSYARNYGMNYDTLARTIRYNNLMASTSVGKASAKAAAKASAGRGGRSSFGGGGGFSGGGFGGGSR